jgi:hypothetical protein
VGVVAAEAEGAGDASVSFIWAVFLCQPIVSSKCHKVIKSKLMQVKNRFQTRVLSSARATSATSAGPL